MRESVGKSQRGRKAGRRGRGAPEPVYTAALQEPAEPAAGAAAAGVRTAQPAGSRADHGRASPRRGGDTCGLQHRLVTARVGPARRFGPRGPQRMSGTRLRISGPVSHVCWRAERKNGGSTKDRRLGNPGLLASSQAHSTQIRREREKTKNTLHFHSDKCSISQKGGRQLSKGAFCVTERVWDQDTAFAAESVGFHRNTCVCERKIENPE